MAFLPWASVYDQYVHRYYIYSIILASRQESS